ncbi:MAG: aspartate--tRNA ligase [Clostridiales bacterium]|jgi:aspartyl-tRNA synthetase|nr:aspartate--tRNA ligase [Clostridiales bacterium]
MGESMQGLKRTHYCAEVNENNIGQEVVVMGWVSHNRNFGPFLFVTIRDRTGIVQTYFNQEENKLLFDKASSTRGEFVVAVRGEVIARTEKNINPNLKTGKIEIRAEELRILSESEVPPFTPSDTGVKDDLRLKYRYIDLRRPELQKNLFLRHKAAQVVRKFFDSEGYIEVETPVLAKSTPEGARDYLVPSRVHPGTFYALPQSPQSFKQLLMVSGFDRYFQITKCFRDEDLRADRQPEFTQIDTELAFVGQEDIFEINERLCKAVFKETLDIDLELPFQRMPYDEAMERFGVDKPDLRFAMELVNITDLVKGSTFGVFENAINAGGSVRGICAQGAAAMSRKQIDSLVEFVKGYRAKGLAWINVLENENKTSLSKFFDASAIQNIVNAFGAKAGDLILICADKTEVVFDALGNLRNEVAKRLNLYNPNDFKFIWVTEFPLFEWSEEDNRLYAKHHPFTSPFDEDVELMDTDPMKVRAKAYDLVLNGYEIAGGSIRIHQREVQEKMFKALGFSLEEARGQFGFLLNAFKYGAPPHGGIAYGFDRLVMILAGSSNIRDVIAFPKVKDASDPLTDAPSAVSGKQLEELGLSLIQSQEKEDN